MPPMRINAVIQPPDFALEHLTRALDSLGLSESQIDWVPPALWMLPVATFGNVALRDAMELETLLKREIGKFRADGDAARPGQLRFPRTATTRCGSAGRATARR